jgi:hypothetical protein
MKSVEALRREAERARRLLCGVSDTRSEVLMTEYAIDCDSRADRLERGEDGEGTNTEDS